MSTNLEGYTIEGLHEIKADLFTIRAHFHEKKKQSKRVSVYLCCLIATLAKRQEIKEISDNYIASEIILELGVSSTIPSFNSKAYKLCTDKDKWKESTEVYVARGNKYRLTFLNRLIRRVRAEISKREKV